MAVILFRFDNGALGSVTLSQVSAGRKNFLWFEICGAKTAYHWEQENPNELWIGHRDRSNELLLKDPSLFHDGARSLTGFPGGHAEGYPDTFLQMFMQFYTAVERGQMPSSGEFATFIDGHHKMVLCEMIKRSAKEQRWVNINEIPA